MRHVTVGSFFGVKREIGLLENLRRSLKLSPEASRLYMGFLCAM